MCVCCGALVKAIDAYLVKADSDLAATLGDEGFAEPQKTVQIISALEECVVTALLCESERFLKAANRAKNLAQFQMDTWPKLKANDSLQADLQVIFREQFGAIVQTFADSYFFAVENRDRVTKASMNITRVSRQTTAWVENWSKELAEIMQLNSHQEIEDIMTKGIEDGIGIPEFTRKIQSSGIRDEWYKARRVAVTEVLTAHRAAQQEAYLQSPSTTGKRWRHTGMYIHGPRQNHKDMDGRIVPKEQPFELLGADGKYYYPMFPGGTNLPPGERIECHCTMQGVVDEEILGLSLEERQRLQQEALEELDEKWFAEQEKRSKALAGFTDNASLTTATDTSKINRENLISAIKSRFDMQLTDPQKSEFSSILDGMTDGQLALYDQMQRNHADNLYHLTEQGAAYYPSQRKVKMDINNPSWERNAGTGQTAAWHTKFHEECHQLDHILATQGCDFADPEADFPFTVRSITSPETATGKKLLKAIENDIVSVINRTVDEKNAVRVDMGLAPAYKRITSLNRVPEDIKRLLILWLRDNYRTDKDRALVSLFTDAVGLATKGKITPYKAGFWGHKFQYNQQRDGSGATSETFANFGSIFFTNNAEERSAIQNLMPSTWKAYSELFEQIMSMIANEGKIFYQ